MSAFLWKNALIGRVIGRARRIEAEKVPDTFFLSQVGWKSPDGTKVVRWTSAATKGYLNLVNKATGGNLHVRW